ncbi:Crp/Fnr family transcriptional regulator [Aromatoleum aromaticum]|uniref:Transcriptional regulator, Dnr-type n=1 Tax=Aromatoleum aromaticum (strain DSM 19018 / LMG 30748 / EbN1) TaxID=76114 RepID=Q5P3L5_AROAE|nr:Crp/Fnr family transcriptional regulator [Aromatoleum aromaticum]NMG55664.1 helix-turn-helix domain-containing protein [Aromatoleum aromaticum]CAI08099.1 Transcriptional regulator, Dnr-type [Aromatoleum aromaticum EbN1]
MATAIHPPAFQSLSCLEPFSSLDPATLQRLSRGVRVCRASRGEMLMHRGARPAGMYAVVEGEVKLFLISSAGAEKIVRLAGRGESFCEENILSDTPQTLAAQATRDSVVLHLQRPALQTAMAAHPSLTQALMARLSQRMGELVEGMEQCIQRSSTQRVAHYLVQHADCSAPHAEVRLSCDKQTIASQLNLTPETFSRVLNRLTRDGIIVPRGRRSITLTDLRSLQSIAA